MCVCVCVCVSEWVCVCVSVCYSGSTHLFVRQSILAVLKSQASCSVALAIPGEPQTCTRPNEEAVYISHTTTPTACVTGSGVSCVYIFHTVPLGAGICTFEVLAKSHISPPCRATLGYQDGSRNAPTRKGWMCVELRMGPLGCRINVVTKKYAVPESPNEFFLFHMH